MSEVDKTKFATLLNHIAPDSRPEALEALNLGFSNRSFRMLAIHADNSQTKYVVKQYSSGENGFGQTAQARAGFEYTLLTFLRDSGIPSPEPVFCDASGAIIGSPVLVTRNIPGEQILAHPANPLWAEKAATVAALLARIHRLACPAEVVALLPDAATQATRFLESETIPDYMQAYPDGEPIWKILSQEFPRRAPADPVLAHGDYWSGNMLWAQGRLTGILDWENVAFGDPGFDVANCRMEMFIDGMDEAADTFLEAYEAHTGKALANLGLCELGVAVHLMSRRAPFLTVHPYQERYRRFVANAQKRL